MDPFVVTGSNGQTINLRQTAMPKGKDAALPAGESYEIEENFGSLQFSHVATHDADFWLSTYNLRSPVQLRGALPGPSIEWQFALTDLPPYKSRHLTAMPMRRSEHLLGTQPCAETLVSFQGQTRYQTLDIHLQPRILSAFAQIHAPLARIVEAYQAGRPAHLTETALGCTPGILQLLQQVRHPVLSASFQPLLAHAVVMELLVHLCAQTSGQPASPWELRIAKAAFTLIGQDLSQCPRVSTLAQQIGTDEARLQLAFRKTYGTTVARYARELRLQKAHNLLQEHNYPLRVICEMVGYPDPSNFSIAFKNYFGYSPGKLRRDEL